MKTKEEIKMLIRDAATFAECEADTRESVGEDWDDNDADKIALTKEVKEIRDGIKELDETVPQILQAVDALELLRRGLECGVFDDAPVFKADVVKVLEGK